MTVMQMSNREQTLLEKCREIEFLSRDLYTFFAEIYEDDFEASRLWRKTALEEQNHADQFSLALKMKKSLSCLVAVDERMLESVLSQLRSVIELVRDQPPTHLEALDLSIKLEKYLNEFHIHCVAAFEDESYKKMFQAMMSSDQEHIATLQRAFEELSGAEATHLPHNEPPVSK
ncbi:MAG: hypothetical protein WCP10_05140 [Desulfuromonadales bacterium]